MSDEETKLPVDTDSMNDSQKLNVMLMYQKLQHKNIKTHDDKLENIESALLGKLDDPNHRGLIARVSNVESITGSTKTTVENTQIILDGTPDTPGLKTRVDRMEQDHKRWKVIIGSVHTAILGAFGALWLWVKNKIGIG